MGMDLNLEQEKLKAMPTMNQFVEEQYLPHAKGYKRSWRMDEQMFVNRIKPVWGNMKLCEINRQEIELFRQVDNAFRFPSRSIPTQSPPSPRLRRGWAHLLF